MLHRSTRICCLLAASLLLMAGAHADDSIDSFAIAGDFADFDPIGESVSSGHPPIHSSFLADRWGDPATQNCGNPTTARPCV